MKKIITLLLVLVSYVLPVSASPESELEALKRQNIELAAQNTELRQSISTSQSIYFGALGFSGAFLIAFLGVNIYFSKTRADEDREKLEALLSERLKQSTLLMKNEVKDDLDKIKTQHLEIIEGHKDKIVNDFNKTFDELKSERKYIDYRMTVIEYDALSDDSSNKLTQAMKVIAKAEAIGWEWKTASMLAQVEKHLEIGLKFYPSEMSDALRQLSQIKSPNDALAKKVESKILSIEK
ncbi:hypothetical protein ACEWA9_14510 [Vibrio parahaemolyticus]